MFFRKILIKLTGFILLFSLFSVQAVEAKRHSHVRHNPTAKNKVKEKNIKKKKGGIRKKMRHSQTKAKKQTQRVIRNKRQSKNLREKEVQIEAKKQSKVALPRKKILARKASGRNKRHHSLPVNSAATYLSQLKPHTQKNAKLGGLDKLYSQNLLGQGQTIAVIELAGTWEEMKKVVNNVEGDLPNDFRERYKRNFLPPIGGPKLEPEVITEWMWKKNPNPNHGSSVSSVVLDLAPQAQVLPVSTYDCPQTGFYDIGHAFEVLAQRQDVNVINISSGELEKTLDVLKNGYKADGTDKYIGRYTFPQRHLDAITRVVRSGKALIFGAGNEGEEVQGPEFREKIRSYRERFFGYLIENLDPEILQSIIFVGAFDPNTYSASGYSNRPGNWLEAQNRFLFAPGKHQTSYNGIIDDGTSNAAPYICAALANLCSKPGVTPKMAVRALLDSADERPEKAIYGRGIIRADRALDLLERGL